MPLPNNFNGTNTQGYAWQPPSNNYINYQQPPQTAQPWPSNWQQPQQSQQQISSRVMSIAPASSRENAQQFPVAVNTDLYLVNRQEMKLYFKNNPANPSEMEEFDLIKVEKRPEPTDTVTRAEIDEIKVMMSQMMGMIQGAQQTNQQKPYQDKKFNGKRGNRNDRSDNISANDE